MDCKLTDSHLFFWGLSQLNKTHIFFTKKKKMLDGIDQIKITYMLGKENYANN